MKLALLSSSSVLVAVVLSLGLSSVGCSAEEEAAPPPVETKTDRFASKLERKLTKQIAIPVDSAIGKTIDAIVAARLGVAVTSEPAPVPAEGEEGAEPAPAAEPTASSGNGLTARPSVGTIGANGRKCTVTRWDDDTGAEQMRRTKCEKTEELKVGAVTYSDESGDSKIDRLVDASNDARYEAYDDDRDGKLDRVVEFETRIAAPPPALGDFGEDVTIVDNGKIESRTREDRDHDGQFDFEALTATTSFRLRK